MPEVNVHLPEGTVRFNVSDTGANEERARMAAEAICRGVYKGHDGVFHTNRPVPGSEEVYDTLDNFPAESLKSIKSLDDVLIKPLGGVVGVIIGGQCALSDPSDGYWGRGLRLLTGEHIQIRQTPRGLIGKPVGDESRMIAIRLTGHSQCTQVFVAMVFNPRICVTGEESLPLTSARTIGCRGVHLLLPSLFNKHDPHRDTSKGHADIDLDGFHSIRPSCVSITKTTKSNRRGTKGEISFSICPGDAYLVMAAHMVGLDQPDPIKRSSQSMSDDDHVRSVHNTTRRLCAHAGEQKAAASISSALTIADLLGAEGIIGMLCNSFFEGVLPDMLHSPIGITLVMVMAMRIACYPEKFGLKQGVTPQDAYANNEMCAMVNSRWVPVAKNGMLAIDVVIESGLKNAHERVKEESGLASCLEDNMKFWQRVGQRVITKTMADPHGAAAEEARSGSHLNTSFGRAELVEDAVSDIKYQILAKAGMAQPIYEAPINKITLAPKADIRTTLVRIHDCVEIWLRTGMYGDVQLSKNNVNVAKPSEKKKHKMMKVDSADLPFGVCPCCADKILNGQEDCDCINSPDEGESSSDSSSSTVPNDSSDDDLDEMLDNKLCLDAMESAAGASSIAMLHGAFVVHQFGIETYLVGDGCSNLCADCDNVVTPLQGVLLNCSVGECPKCNRRRCFDCAEKALGNMKPVTDGCKRCGEEGKGDIARKPVEGSSSSKGKKKK